MLRHPLSISPRTVEEATRTYADNIKEAVYLRVGLGHIPIKALRPKHAAKYLAQRADDDAAVRRNCEKALLSHCFTKAIVEAGWTPILVAGCTAIASGSANA